MAWLKENVRPKIWAFFLAFLRRNNQSNLRNDVIVLDIYHDLLKCVTSNLLKHFAQFYMRRKY